MSDRKDPNNEGHSREWQDRARVVIDAKEAAQTEASPNQSPETDGVEKDNSKTEKKESGDNNSNY